MPVDLDWPTMLAAAVVAVIGTARLVKLGTEDDFPPAAWLRDRWIDRFNTSTWSDLATCPFCQAPYWSVMTIVWGWASELHWLWWAFYGTLALAYLAAILVARDIPNGD